MGVEAASASNYGNSEGPTAAPVLARIRIFPLKSFGPVELASATLLPSGALAGDRQFALQTEDGKFLNAKNSARIHGCPAQIDLCSRTFSFEGLAAKYSIENDLSKIEQWFSTYFAPPVRLIENGNTGFPDDLDAPGPTLVSSQSLEVVASWFSPITVDEIRLRFRANLEFNAPSPFWEDRLYQKASPLPFHIGAAHFLGTNPCQRCVVPTRNTHSGDVTPLFQKRFCELRAATLPAWAPKERFNHFYHLSVNTQVTVPAEIHVGDLLTFDGPLVFFAAER